VIEEWIIHVLVILLWRGPLKLSKVESTIWLGRIPSRLLAVLHH
jgi:hypothetical protein